MIQGIMPNFVGWVGSSEVRRDSGLTCDPPFKTRFFSGFTNSMFQNQSEVAACTVLHHLSDHH